MPMLLKAGRAAPAAGPEASALLGGSLTTVHQPYVAVTTGKPILKPLGRQMLEIAGQVTKDYPVLRESASVFITKALRQKFGKILDPDTTYLHRFDKRHSSHVSFDGWAHNQPPFSSMTITQAVLANYSAHDQSQDTLNGYSAGLYSEGPLAGTFDEHNEIKLLPSQLLKLIYESDFYKAYQTQLTCFWNKHRADHSLLARTQFTSHANRERANGTLTPADYATVMAANGVNLPTVPVPGHPAASPEVTVRKLDINGYESSDILHFQRAGDPRIVLYLPGESVPLRSFPNNNALNDWICQVGPVDKARQHLTSHFSLYNRQDSSSIFGSYGVDSSLKFLVTDYWPRSKINIYHGRISSTVVSDIFVHITAATEHRDLADADSKITSTAEVNTDIFRERLELLNTVTALTAPFAAPINLMLALGSMAQFTLGISRALDGDTSTQRAAGVSSGALAVLGVLPIGALPREAGSEVAAAEDLASAKTLILKDAEATIEGFVQEDPELESLAPFDTWLGDPTAIDMTTVIPDKRGVYTVATGTAIQQFVVRRGQAFEVFATPEKVQLVNQPFAILVVEPLTGEWLASASHYENPTRSPMATLRQAMKTLGWNLDEQKANRLIAEQVFQDVRKAYSGGYKSSNKVYVGVTKAAQLAARRDVAHYNLQISRNRPPALATPRLPAGSVLPQNVAADKMLVIEAANCGELSDISAKLAMEYGIHAEQWFVENGDHAFTVIGQPPLGPTVDFSNWKGVWIVDAWANIVCPAKEYVTELVKKMGEWKVKGKRLTDGRDTFEATDTLWLSSLVNNRKIMEKAPTPAFPFPWQDYSLQTRPRRPHAPTP